MLDRMQTIEKLKSTRQYLDEHYGVHSMTLFGSLARKEQREDSDVDICVVMAPNLFNRAGVKNCLLELLGCDVDVKLQYVSTSTPCSVMSSVCSHCALGCSSPDITSQP